MEDVLRGFIFETRGEPASDVAIRSFEEDRGFQLPEQYRDFLTEGDGGIFRQYNEIAGTNEGALNKMFSLSGSPDTPGTLPYALRVWAGRVPDEFIPIANEAAGNLFCLAVAGDEVGSIYFWDHEMEVEDDEAPTKANMIFISPSLEAFLSLINIV